jgi:hypothetical protein
MGLELPISVAPSPCKSAGDCHGQFTRLQNSFLSFSGPVYICASIGGEKAGGQFKSTSWDTSHPSTANSLSCGMAAEIQKGTMLLDVVSR